MGLFRHQEEILLNQSHWQKKPILQLIYREFYRLIAAQLTDFADPLVVELGSGIGNIKEVIPNCIRTDVFPNPWLDQVENAYQLSFADGSVSDLILFDVFHHLRYPGTALLEFKRALRPRGRVIIFDPYVSLLGAVVYGIFHPEAMAYQSKIVWKAPQDWSATQIDYYAAQGNATRIFFGKSQSAFSNDWVMLQRKRLSALSYVASGGYSKPQLYPDRIYPFLRAIEPTLERFPMLFSTRALVVLEKKG